MSKIALSTVATRHQVLLERLKTQTAYDFTKVLPKVTKAIADVVNSLGVGNVSDLSRTALQGTLKDLRAAQDELFTQARDSLLVDLQAIGGSEVGFETRALRSVFTAANMEDALQVVSASDVWKATLSQPLSASGSLLESFVDSWSERSMDGVDSAVMKAWGEGRTIGQLMQDIRGTKALGYKDGLADVSRRQAEAIARTAVQHVSQQARMETWAANADIIEGWTFVATLDGRTTQQCRSLDGQMFKLGEGPQPPVHVNCRSTSVPKMPSEFDFLDEGATRSSKDGYVAADQTYYDWLKGQPEAFQDEALGPARAQLFRDGGLSAKEFAALNLDRNFKPMTLAEMQAKEPAVFERSGVTPPSRP